MSAVPLRCFHGQSIAVIQSDRAVIIDYRRIMGQVAQVGTAVRIANEAKVLIPPGRCITDCHTDGSVMRICDCIRSTAADAVIEVIASVIASYHVRCIQVTEFTLHAGVLLRFKDHALITPIAEIVSWGAPADIVALLAVTLTTFHVVRAEKIKPAPKDMGFPVRNCFPDRQEWIINLISHYLPPYAERAAEGCRCPLSADYEITIIEQRFLRQALPFSLSQKPLHHLRKHLPVLLHLCGYPAPEGYSSGAFPKKEGSIRSKSVSQSLWRSWRSCWRWGWPCILLSVIM